MVYFKRMKTIYINWHVPLKLLKENVKKSVTGNVNVINEISVYNQKVKVNASTNTTLNTFNRRSNIDLLNTRESVKDWKLEDYCLDVFLYLFVRDPTGSWSSRQQGMTINAKWLRCTCVTLFDCADWPILRYVYGRANSTLIGGCCSEGNQNQRY